MFLPSIAAFLVGLVLGAFLPYLPLLILSLAILASGASTILERVGRLTVRLGVLLCASLAAGVLYWTVFAWATAGSPLAEVAGPDPVLVVGQVVEPVRYAPDRAIVVLDVRGLRKAGQGEAAGGGQQARGRVRLTWREPDLTLKPGDSVSFTTRLRPPSGTVNPGGFDYGAYLRRQGVDAVAFLAGPGQIVRRPEDPASLRWGLWRTSEGWRAQIRRAAIATLQGPALGIYLGIIVGDSGYLTQTVRDAFMATGTVHILSISGSHLGLIAFLSFWIVKGACRLLPASWFLALTRRVTPTRLAAALTALPVSFYTLLAGAEVATVRSLIMILLFLLAVWLGREEQLVLTLAFAALIILLHDPRALFDISFQLSYCSVLALALVLRWRVRRDEAPAADSSGTSRMARWLRGYGWITGGVTLATAPLVAYHFNQVAWLGLVANLIVVPLAGFLLVPLGLGSAVWILLSGRESLAAGWLNQTCLDLLSQVVTWIARVPGAEWHVASPAIPAVAAFYVMLALALRTAGSQTIRGISTLGLTLLLGWWIWSPRPASDGDTVRVAFLDVGQGDACVLELPDGRVILIDGGAVHETLDMGRAVVAPYLWDRGIRSLDAVIGTHPQLDHVGGLAGVLRSFRVSRFWSNGVQRNEPFYRRLMEALRDRGVSERVAESGQEFLDEGPCRILALNPPPRSGGNLVVESGSALNNLSIVTRLDCGPHSFLFTADVEAEALARLLARRDSSRARVLKVPHHGARSSLDEQWIERSGAEVAIVSVGSRNPYGHPAPEVLTAYEKRGIRMYRTDRDGAVTVVARLSSSPFEVRRARELVPRPVPVNRSMWIAERENLRRFWEQWRGTI
ncbi:MAG: DNA internalization-related competence protein ComEC/Rec2 [Nitrospirota bacterium]